MKKKILGALRSVEIYTKEKGNSTKSSFSYASSSAGYAKTIVTNYDEVAG